MYDELIRKLRELASIPAHCETVDSCDGCSKEDICLRFTNERIIETASEAADAIESTSKAYQMMAEAYEAEVTKPKWIPVTERLPETGVDVLVMFPQNMAVASRDMGEWVVNSGDGWCTDVNLSDDEKEPTHWMPLPQPPKEEGA